MKNFNRSTIERYFYLNPRKILAFTMAEILLSLTIIGVVAAITLPSLTGNINERTWNTQKKTLYARFSQAIALMPALNGYGTVTEDESGSITEDNATETFITSGLSKVLKINNICDNEHLADCGINSKYTNIAGSIMSTATTLFELNEGFQSVLTGSFSTYNTKAAAFETQNGESIIAYYNPNCRAETLMSGYNSIGNDVSYPQATMCVNFIYDLNGNKGPNTIGKDIGFITAFNSVDTIVVAPIPSSYINAGEVDYNQAISICKNQSIESRLPNIDELSSLFINKNSIFLTSDGNNFWSGTVVDSEHVMAISLNTQTKYVSEKSGNRGVRCIKR